MVRRAAMEESSYSSESLIETDQACKYVMTTITTIREESYKYGPGENRNESMVSYWNWM